MRYLANTRPDHIPDHFYPSNDLRLRAKVDEYLDWHHLHLREGSVRLVFKKYFAFLRKMERKWSDYEINETEKVLLSSLKQLENNLHKTKKYLVSEKEMTLADLVATSDLN